MLDTFGIQQGGSQYRRLVGSFQRVFGATIFFGTESQRKKALVVPPRAVTISAGFLDSARQILGSGLTSNAPSSHVNGCTCLAEGYGDSASCAAAGARDHTTIAK